MSVKSVLSARSRSRFGSFRLGSRVSNVYLYASSSKRIQTRRGLLAGAAEIAFAKACGPGRQKLARTSCTVITRANTANPVSRLLPAWRSRSATLGNRDPSRITTPIHSRLTAATAASGTSNGITFRLRASRYTGSKATRLQRIFGQLLSSRNPAISRAKITATINMSVRCASAILVSGPATRMRASPAGDVISM